MILKMSIFFCQSIASNRDKNDNMHPAEDILRLGVHFINNPEGGILQ